MVLQKKIVKWAQTITMKRDEREKKNINTSTITKISTR
jgi:hypothetical protein